MANTQFLIAKILRCIAHS